MRNKMINFLHKTQPQMEGNQNINAYQEAQLPVSERAGKTG